MLEQVHIEKLVHGGQGLGHLSNGKKAFVWNALPGEQVAVRITKKRKDYVEAIAEEIVTVSKDRVTPKDAAYLSTSPWQAISWSAENRYKQEILTETMLREGVRYKEDISFYSGHTQWQYRNKMEYSFWADDDGLHLALYGRGTHMKQIVEGSSLARPEIDVTARKIVGVLNAAGIRGSQVKTVIVRCDQLGNTVAALFVKDESFPNLQEFEKTCKGVSVCFSTPKSPASVITKELYSYGDITLCDSINGVDVRYGVHSFFQVNVPVFEVVTERIRELVAEYQITDLYCGVGSIGLAVGNTEVYVDIDENNCEFARMNAVGQGEVVHTSSENALHYINSMRALIVDPPRAGLHQKLIERITDTKPPVIAYLSCNPSTQARDLSLLQNDYNLETLEGYNFFPKTPHIESLAVLKIKDK